MSGRGRDRPRSRETARIVRPTRPLLKGPLPRSEDRVLPPEAEVTVFLPSRSGSSLQAIAIAIGFDGKLLLASER